MGENIEADFFLNFIKDYGFDNYFNEFPQGLSTIIGEGGIKLSGGQKQIIGLARAVFKKPQFLILDEASASMDRKSEKFCLNVLKKLKNDSLILFISHRLNTLKDTADVIYILENNTIMCYGNHNKLLETKNFYSDYFLDYTN